MSMKVIEVQSADIGFNDRSQPVYILDYSGGTTYPLTSLWKEGKETPPSRDAVIEIPLNEDDEFTPPVGDDWNQIQVVGRGDLGGYVGYYKVHENT